MDHHELIQSRNKAPAAQVAAGSSPKPRGRRRSLKARALTVPAFAILCLGFVVPLIVVVIMSFLEPEGYGLDHYRTVLSSPVFATILWRTVFMAVASTAICALVAYPFALVLATRMTRAAPLLLALVAVPYLSSVLIRSYAWVAVLGGNGLVNRALISMGIIDYPIKLVYNSFGSYIGTIHIMLPMMILPIYAAMRRIDTQMMRAAAALSAGPISAFATVWLPLSAPGLLAGSLLVFLNVLGFYVTPALLGAPGDYLLAQAIEVRVSTLGEFGVASTLSTILVLLVGGCLLLARDRIFVGKGPASGGGSAKSDRAGEGLSPSASRRFVAMCLRHLAPFEMRLARLLRSLGTAHVVLTLVFLLVPMAVVIIISFSNDPYLAFPPRSYGVRWFDAFLSDSRWTTALFFSLGIALTAAATALVVSVPFALAISRGRGSGVKALWLMALAPMILPHIVTGLGLFFAFVRLGLNGHFVTFWIAYTTIGIPYVVVILLAAYERFDSNIERAAIALGARPTTAFRTVTLPILATSFATAFFFAFLMTFDELIIGLFLSSPTQTTLPVRMWEDIAMEINPKTAVVGTLQLAVLLLGVGAARLVSGRFGPGQRARQRTT